MALRTETSIRLLIQDRTQVGGVTSRTPTNPAAALPQLDHQVAAILDRFSPTSEDRSRFA